MNELEQKAYTIMRDTLSTLAKHSMSSDTRKICASAIDIIDKLENPEETLKPVIVTQSLKEAVKALGMKNAH